MLSFAIDRRCEIAPHANRSIAMALALSLNLAILLVAMRPSTPFTLHAPAPQAVIAILLQTPPKAPELPPLPKLHPINHVVVPSVTVPTVHPMTITRPVLNSIAPVQSNITPTPNSTTTQPANTDATIAYATATPPPYPLNAVRTGAQGTVLLKVLVDANGAPVAVKVERSSGSRELDIAARTHVLATWRFHPAVRDGHTIEAWVLVPVKFDLNNL